MSDEITTTPIGELVETTTTEVVSELSTPTPTPSPAEIEVKQEVKEEAPRASPLEVPAIPEEVVVATPVVEEKVESETVVMPEENKNEGNISISEDVKEVIPSESNPSPTVIPPVSPSPSIIIPVTSNSLPVEPILKPEPEIKLEPKIEIKPEINPTTTPEVSTISPLDRIALSFKANMLKARENLVLARKATKAKMMKSVYKVLDLFKKKKKIKNVDVQKFVHVSDSTATDYLNILTKEGKVKREGKPTAPTYTKND